MLPLLFLIFACSSAPSTADTLRPPPGDTETTSPEPSEPSEPCPYDMAPYAVRGFAATVDGPMLPLEEPVQVLLWDGTGALYRDVPFLTDPSSPSFTLTYSITVEGMPGVVTMRVSSLHGTTYPDAPTHPVSVDPWYRQWSANGPWCGHQALTTITWTARGYEDRCHGSQPPFLANWRPAVLHCECDDSCRGPDEGWSEPAPYLYDSEFDAPP